MEAGASATADGGEAALRRAHAALMKTDGLQFDFGLAPAANTPEWVKALLEALRAAAPVLKVVVWIGLAVGLGLIVWFFARELLATRLRPKRDVPTLVDWRPDPAAARALLEEADALAAAGRFSEAIHLILFRSIEEIGGRRPGALRPALTSRDIAAEIAMPPDARGAFARITESVERTFFGGRAAASQDFSAARADYEAFAFSEGWA